MTRLVRDELCAVVELNNAEREQLLLEHLPHVQHIARRIYFRLPPQVPFEDLVHAGMLGLMDAVRKFDPSKNVQLKCYAEFRIRGAILDSLREVDWSPRTLRRKGRQLETAVSKCEARFGRSPTESELSAELGISLDELQELSRDLHGLSVGNIQSDNGQSSEGREVARRAIAEDDDPFCCALKSEMIELLMTSMADLPDRDREVLILYHFRELSMKNVGRALGIGESRVSQIHTAALFRLRERLLERMRRKTPL